MGHHAGRAHDHHGPGIEPALLDAVTTDGTAVLPGLIEDLIDEDDEDAILSQILRDAVEQ